MSQQRKPIPVKLSFQGYDLSDIFAQKNNKTLGETILHHRYANLASEVRSNYGKCLNDGLGTFLYSLKISGDRFYRQFLNEYGDYSYCRFSISEHLYDKGLYFYTLENRLVYVGRCRDFYGKRTNQGYGVIHPKNCYRDGQSTNCRINALINQNKDKIRFYVDPMDDIAKIESEERRLIQELKPEWNK